MRLFELKFLILFVKISLVFSDSDHGQTIEGSCSVDERCSSHEQNHGHHDMYRRADNQQTLEVQKKKCIRVAALEFHRQDLNDCKESARRNLDRLERATRLAAENGAQMIVYPEDGIFFGDQTSTLPCVEAIPDPESLSDMKRNPCLQGDIFKPYEILTRLSCIARENRLYVIANYGSKQTCDPNVEIVDSLGHRQDCPKNGILSLNTDVVFDDNGNYIKRYRKWNTHIEPFSKSPVLEHTYFDTPFGRFGVFTCFDIIFKRPALDLVENYHIDAAIFPTYWLDELPLFTAVQAQDGWSWANKVDIIASNILSPQLGATGSGIFSGLDAAYVAANNKKSKLIMANVQSRAGNQSESPCSGGFQPLILDLEERAIEADYQYKNYHLLMSDRIHRFDTVSGDKTICSGDVCCSVDYELSEKVSPETASKLVLIVRDARRDGYFKWHEQVCSLATIKHFTEASADKPASIIFNSDAIVSFKRLSVSATFTTNYVYPISAHNASLLLDRAKRSFECDDVKGDHEGSIEYYCQLDLSARAEPTRLYSFGMYGRPYESDAIPITG